MQPGIPKAMKKTAIRIVSKVGKKVYPNPNPSDPRFSPQSSKKIKNNQLINRLVAGLPLPIVDLSFRLIDLYRRSRKKAIEAKVPQWPTILWWTVVSASPKETFAMR